MTLDITTPTFEEVYAETRRGYLAAGIEDADLTYLTREFYEGLQAETEQDAAPSRASASDRCDAGNPDDPIEGVLLHHMVFLGG